MAKVTRDMIIADVLKMDKGTVPIFLNAGMHCLGCPSASGESIEEACQVHGIDADKLVKELNDFLESK
jgi:hybrid cluster-associated redox disulfide protein